MPLRPPHVRERRTDDEERAAKIDVHHLVPVLDAERRRVAEAAEPRGGDDEIEASERTRRGGDRVFDAPCIADIARCRGRPGELAGQRVESITIPRGEGDPSATAGERARGRRADPARRAAHERAPSVHGHRAGPSYVNAERGVS